MAGRGARLACLRPEAPHAGRRGLAAVRIGEFIATHRVMENAEVARVLAELADLLELTGENTFKARAYRQAAQVIDTLPGPVSELWLKGELTSLPGIGERIAAQIVRLLESGELTLHRHLVGQVPPGVLQMMRLEGIGPKTAAQIWHQLGVTDLGALARACADGTVLTLPRMGPVRARSIAKAIERRSASGQRTPLHHVLPYCDALLTQLRRLAEVRRAEVAGSVRRKRETVADLDLLVASIEPGAVVRAFVKLPNIASVISQGPTKSSVRLRPGLQVDLRVVPPESFGAALQYFTGSKSHNIALRTRALQRGLKLNEYGIFGREGRRLGGEEEEEVFRALGLPWIPPELREGAGEVEAAERGELPRLIEEGDLLGDLHAHSKEGSSDGRTRLEDLAAEADRLGRQYLAITDHSRSRPLGLDPVGIKAHAAAIRALDARLGGRPRLLAGVEVDILADGSLDLPREELAALDWVVASVHSRFKDPPEIMTERIVRALRSGVVDVLGHPTGRQIGAREPYSFDFARVLSVAREAGVALEVNAMPDRLDLSDRMCRQASEAGVPVVISTDSHHGSQLGNLRYGVWVARRGWLSRKEVLNSLPLRELMARSARRRPAATVQSELFTQA